MKPEGKLSIRCPRGNLNHHLWNNHGTWWCHLTLHLPDFTKRRLRFSLGTDQLDQARRRRDRWLANPCPGNGGAN
jgi:hypothetical protein